MWLCFVCHCHDHWYGHDALTKWPTAITLLFFLRGTILPFLSLRCCLGPTHDCFGVCSVWKSQWRLQRRPFKRGQGRCGLLLFHQNHHRSVLLFEHHWKGTRHRPGPRTPLRRSLFRRRGHRKRRSEKEASAEGTAEDIRRRRGCRGDLALDVFVYGHRGVFDSHRIPLRRRRRSQFPWQRSGDRRKNPARRGTVRTTTPRGSSRCSRHGKYLLSLRIHGHVDETRWKPWRS
mmetsp:Transcript_2254/g.4761  ORF Transcript_2254/g.4761 Transcript_2254/m.4761 type:complete len:232 (-) Transcript_2254:824-1519(-)